MNQKQGIFLIVRFVMIMGMILGLVGCAAQPTVEPVPTQDPTLVMQQAVETVAARVTETALHQPTATLPPTATATLTHTPQPTATATQAFTATPAETATPAATNTPPTPPMAAKALYTTAYPENKTERIPNETFGLALGFQNVGTIAWGSGYKVKMVGFEGEATVQQEISTDKSVQPGEKIEFDLWAFGSETLGKHIWYFQLYTAEGIPVPGGSISYSYESK